MQQEMGAAFVFFVFFFFFFFFNVCPSFLIAEALGRTGQRLNWEMFQLETLQKVRAGRNLHWEF
jgi:hypothetical protein